ncbi:MAG: hypoxanthine phosphoribosyltransferase [Oscillospiraceae bacterium]|nr:hypoxanthine phosphoribosyltransferase [Oscillospiraceae bacterium]
MHNSMEEDIRKVLLSEAEIAAIVRRLGEQISRDYEGKKLLVIGVLKGSFVFMADLIRALSVPCGVDFLAVSSYGGGTESSGSVKILKDLDMDLHGCDLLVAEDILDSGRTLSKILEILATRSPRSVRLCAFLDKPERRQVPMRADYVGASVPDEFVVGYGLDYGQRYRNLPYVGVLKPEIYA